MTIHQLAVQPGPRQRPVTFHRDRGDVQHRGGFVHRQPAEEPQLHEARLPGVEPGELVEGRIESDDVRRVSWQSRGTSTSLEGHGQSPHPRFDGAARPRVIHQQTAHDVRRDGEEMRPVLPARASLIDELQVGLVHQRGGAQRMVAPLAHQVAAREPAQLVVHGIHQRARRPLPRRRSMPAAGG